MGSPSEKGIRLAGHQSSRPVGIGGNGGGRASTAGEFLRPGDAEHQRDAADTVRSQQALSGVHWHDWLSVRCPTVLIRGTRSDELSATHARDMAAKRSIRLIELPAGHVVHHDQPDAFAECVRLFLAPVDNIASP
ncbi:alpha/beta fold hydrolase [Streptomyces sp. NPDC002187]|uniref:alpha/beta fold hydrolase n=1 Tax=Streptomyces sp. NPDC002187 TaxID=3364637 RepID=UPI00369C311E